MTEHSANRKGFSLKELAERVNGRVDGDENLIIFGVNSLDRAGPHEISFVSSKRWLQLAKSSSAGALIAKSSEGLEGRNLLIVDDPYLALAVIANLFVSPIKGEGGISPLAFVHEDAEVGEGTTVMEFVYIGEGASIGRRCLLFPHTFIGKRVKIGDETILYPGVVVYDNCEIGKRCIIHAGSVIGADGFGFARGEGGWVKIPQVGRVVIEDEVEIGACVTVDRAAFGETRIGRGTKIDNLVQVGHNVRIGKNCAIVSQTGISGSVEIGDDVMIGGQVGIVGHVRIGNRARIGAKSGVHRDVEEDEDVSGIPVLPHREWLRLNMILRRLLKRGGS